MKVLLFISILTNSLLVVWIAFLSGRVYKLSYIVALIFSHLEIDVKKSDKGKTVFISIRGTEKRFIPEREKEKIITIFDRFIK